ncbi:hypothetical protein [Tuberibacillus sp. Marseille-P3662]|uniref:hypothetical protein n=1 Tax=Tuberibacillus sp. Marseille-P3662 TaxID=1965358 RepID=UPI000A1CEC65|nr:hypothetical protein [Tuberibacillus sp. Marseille-P3662]
MNGKTSKSRHLIDPEISGVIDLIPTNDLTESMLKESRIQTLEMMQKRDVTHEFPVTLEERYVPSYFGGPDIRLEIIKPRQLKYEKMPLYYSVHGGGMVMGSAMSERPAR